MKRAHLMLAAVSAVAVGISLVAMSTTANDWALAVNAAAASTNLLVLAYNVRNYLRARARTNGQQ